METSHFPGGTKEQVRQTWQGMLLGGDKALNVGKKNGRNKASLSEKRL